ncbi:hypothetical protein BU23DRAFT_635004 [Bimuria novae-zelandiae CBS 107.79]|uniref:Uncharacterized protein n=1 Tax=Bimuria novae-zelandiae CBS 107.79 TaxID=1447943 RepID=A0A6A5VGK0_9PLEO|nr:hypothetical protein BU23DRAFT_635004 [Bimuria novae-zelandiae CBS 107.79]
MHTKMSLRYLKAPKRSSRLLMHPLRRSSRLSPLILAKHILVFMVLHNICSHVTDVRGATTSLTYDTEGAFYQPGFIQSSNITEKDKARSIALQLANSSWLDARFHKAMADLANNEFTVELAALFVTAISRVPNWQWYDTSFTKLGNMGTPFTYTRVLQGYGHGSSSTAVILSVTEITAYCIIAISYIAYILITGSPVQKVGSSGSYLCRYQLYADLPRKCWNTRQPRRAVGAGVCA